MPTDEEINVAIEAFQRTDVEVEGMESGRALRNCWRAALEAAERERDRRRIESCTHPNKWGSGTVSGDGSSKLDWYCKDCGKSFHSETPPRPPAPIDILSLPHN